ncbi:hypothetical protein ES703_75288 [subsurface metagenome]
MPDRNDTFHKFGPILLEACCWVLLDYQNELRRNQGMKELTMQDVINNINNHLSELEPYDWMREGEE